MEIIKPIIQTLTAVSGCLAALMSVPVFLRFQWPAPALWIAKLFASALSAVFAFVGVVSIIVGFTTGSVFIVLIGTYVALFFFIHLYRITRKAEVSYGFEQAYGLHWEDRIPVKQKNTFFQAEL